jgi:hypothetical protein
MIRLCFLVHVRKHDGRPFICTRPGCGVRLMTPTEQRAHEQIHLIKESGDVPNLPPLSEPVVSQSSDSRPAHSRANKDRKHEIKPEEKY